MTECVIIVIYQSNFFSCVAEMGFHTDLILLYV